MASHVTKGKRALGTQLPVELIEQFKNYAVGRGETFTNALERAMSREMAYPPPPEKPAPFEPAKKGRAR